MGCIMYWLYCCMCRLLLVPYIINVGGDLYTYMDLQRTLGGAARGTLDSVTGVSVPARSLYRMERGLYVCIGGNRRDPTMVHAAVIYHTS
jgi:serine phosphatase RsbU (regulator of sigma subunit)